MRTVDLARVAAAAEGLLLRRIARRQAFRVVYAVVAALFGLALFVMVHLLVYMGLLYLMRPILAAAVLFVLDGAAAGVFANMALKSKPDSVEQEAVVVRDQALSELKRSLTMVALAGEVVSTVLRRKTSTGQRRGFGSLATTLALRAIGR